MDGQIIHQLIHLDELNLLLFMPKLYSQPLAGNSKKNVLP